MWSGAPAAKLERIEVWLNTTEGWTNDAAVRVLKRLVATARSGPPIDPAVFPPALISVPAFLVARQVKAMKQRSAGMSTAGWVVLGGTVAALLALWVMRLFLGS